MKPKNVSKLIMDDSKTKITKIANTMRTGNTEKMAQMDKAPKGK